MSSGKSEEILLPPPAGTNANPSSFESASMGDPSNHNNGPSPNEQQTPLLSMPLSHPRQPILSPSRRSPVPPSSPRSILNDNASAYDHPKTQEPQSRPPPTHEHNMASSLPRLPTVISSSNLAEIGGDELNIDSSFLEDRNVENNSNDRAMINNNNAVPKKGHSKKISWGFTSFSGEESNIQAGLSSLLKHPGTDNNAIPTRHNKPVPSKGHSKKISWGGASAFPTGPVVVGENNNSNNIQASLLDRRLSDSIVTDQQIIFDGFPAREFAAADAKLNDIIHDLADLNGIASETYHQGIPKPWPIAQSDPRNQELPPLPPLPPQPTARANVGQNNNHRGQHTRKNTFINLSDLASSSVHGNRPGHVRRNTSATFGSRHSPRGHVRRNTNISDITSPLEDEAENAIIRALEEREWENDEVADFKLRSSMDVIESVPAKDSMELGILSGIPDSVVNAIEDDGSATASHDLSSTNPSSVHKPKSSAPSARKTGHRRALSLHDTATQLKLMQEGNGGIGYLKDGIVSKEKVKPLNLAVKSGDGDEELDKLDRATTTSADGPNVQQPVEGRINRLTFDEEAQCRGSNNSSTSRPSFQRSSSSRNISTRSKANQFRKTFKEIKSDVSIQYKPFCKATVCYAILPSLMMSAIFFYAAGNPTIGLKQQVELTVEDSSYSWWILFVGARQVLMFSLAKLCEIVTIDIFTLRSRIVLRLFGPLIMLLLIQSKGWPFVLIIWAGLDFVFLFGNRRFAMHWLFYSEIKWFTPCFYTDNGLLVGQVTDCNPAGNAVYSDMYFRILISAIVLGFAVSLKRALGGMYQGKKSTERYAPELEKLMAKMLIISEVAQLAEEISETVCGLQGKSKDMPQARNQSSGMDNHATDNEKNAGSQKEESKNSHQSQPETQSGRPSLAVEGSSNELWESMVRFRANSEDFKSTTGGASMSIDIEATSTIKDNASMQDNEENVHASLRKSAKTKLIELVGEWEDPVVNKSASTFTNTSIQDVLQFRQAVLCLDQRAPFGYAFGPARTREKCIESAQNVYERLLMNTGNVGILQFETIALIALDDNGDIDENKAKKIIRMFRPDRNGNLTELEFVKSCDKVYKQLRTLRAAIKNSSQIDRAFDQIVNVLFYFVMILVLLTIFRIDPWALFASISAFVLGFSFMFGPAASKYFEGILLILVQHPFDIGDRIHISDPRQDTSSNGSSTWYVEGITLYSTTVRYATTNEIATYSNGSLANTRIINANRSPDAQVYIYVKFASDVPFEKVMVFKSVIESFVKERPNQWIKMNGFRATRIEADLGFIEYVIVLTHVETWQQYIPILTSKAEVSSYCLEVQRKLGMKYQAPPLPVNLGTSNPLGEQYFFEGNHSGEKEEDSEYPDLSALASFFTEPGTKKRQ